MANIADNPIFKDETAARKFLEAQRWADGVFCPYCGQVDTVHSLPARGSMGAGWYHCRSCRRKFTVRVGTLYERSHVPLHKWLLATHLMVSSKKGISSHQLHRMLGVTYKTAWFMTHRIREGMCEYDPPPIGGSGKTVEIDETYFGWDDEGPRKGKRGKKPGPAGKRAVVALVERGGEVRTFHVDRADAKTTRDILMTHAHRTSDLRTDESSLYIESGKDFASHESVTHSHGEYVRDDVHTNTIEGFFSIFKRGMKGVYQHCDEKHLHRYLSEFEFRYNTRTKLGYTDEARALAALKGIEGKRLTYRRHH